MTSVLLYKSLVLPHLDSCDIVYSCTSTSNLHNLELVQNSTCRILLLADKRCPVDEMHSELKILNLTQSDLHLAVGCHEHVYNDQCNLNKFFKAKNTRTARRPKALELPNLRIENGRKAYSYRGPMKCMQIPENISSIVDQEAFKRE